jgi:hypothetical protein
MCPAVIACEPAGPGNQQKGIVGGCLARPRQRPGQGGDEIGWRQFDPARGGRQPGLEKTPPVNVAQLDAAGAALQALQAEPPGQLYIGFAFALFRGLAGSLTPRIFPERSRACSALPPPKACDGLISSCSDRSLWPARDEAAPPPISRWIYSINLYNYKNIV